MINKNIVPIIMALLFAGAAFFFGRSSVDIGSNVTPLQQKVDTLRKKDISKEKVFNTSVAANKITSSEIKEINKTIEKSIYNILKQNEKNKQRTVNAGDSIKSFIADSMLRANRYK